MAISMGMQVAWLLEHGKQYPKNYFGSFFEANPLLGHSEKSPSNLRRKAAKLASCDHLSLSLSLSLSLFRVHDIKVFTFFVPSMNASRK
jgi:hypothetical protein